MKAERTGTVRQVDIVVPVYNGYEDLLLCVESLKKYTNLSLHRVILIDDKSPDSRIRPYLENLKRTPGFMVILNEKNKGFSANVNIGLAYSGRDTILLNSDTIVTSGWVEKLQRCAYSSERTATVTPLSNAATLASVPVFLKDNRIPDGFSVQEYALLAERVSLRRFPRIPVSVGFCMYVKQEAYEAAGPFDAAAFGRGYGEENDFCFRCGMLGYTHTLCDDTFIYHKGTASFHSEEKKKLCEEHDRILRKRYPAQTRENDRYCAENPDQEIRDNLNLYTKLANGKRNLLYFLHLDFQGIAKDHIGGTQLHVRDLVFGARKDFNVFVAARDDDTLRLTIYPQGREDSLALKFPIGRKEAFPVFRDEHLAEILRQILTVFDMDLVHVHHTEGLSLDIFDVCESLRIPVICTLHDYYYACPTVKLLNAEGRFCPDTEHFAPCEDSVCRRCLHRTCGYGHVSVIDRWRKENEKALSRCRKIIFPSESAEKVMLAAFPSLKGKSMVVPHGSDPGAGKKEDQAYPGRAEAEKTSRMVSRMELVPGKDNGISYVAGWAYLKGEDNRNVFSVIEAEDRSGARFCLPVRKIARPDVADAAAESGCLFSGFRSVFDVPGMKEGRCRLRVVLKMGDRYYTDGKVYPGYYRRVSEAGTEKGIHVFARERKRLNVAFLGGVTEAKGSRLLTQIIHSGDTNFNFFVFGQIGDPGVIKDKCPDNVFFTGVYEQEDIGRLLSLCRIDIACVLPIWGETFSYTVSEAWGSGIPVLGTDIGAVGERIRETGAGWLVPPSAGEKEVLSLLLRIRNHPEELSAKKKAISSIHLKSVFWMNAEYRTLYGNLLRETCPAGTDRIRHISTRPDDADAVFQAYALANPSVCGHGGEAERNRLREENKMLKNSIEMMKSSLSYRFSRMIADANIPGKEVLKRAVRKKDQGK